MKTYEIEIEGISPLMHNRMSEDALISLLGAKGEKKKVTEERTPREMAEEHAFGDSKNGFFVPTEQVVSAMKHVATDYKQKSSTRKSIKSILGGAFVPCEEFVPLQDKSGRILKAFEVDIRRGNNFQKGAIALCRPRYDVWSAKFTAEIDEHVVEPQVLLQILEDAGRRSGIGSYRVERGGRYGKFIVTGWKELKFKAKSKNTKN